MYRITLVFVLLAGAMASGYAIGKIPRRQQDLAEHVAAIRAAAARAKVDGYPVDVVTTKGRHVNITTHSYVEQVANNLTEQGLESMLVSLDTPPQPSVVASHSRIDGAQTMDVITVTHTPGVLVLVFD